MLEFLKEMICNATGAWDNDATAETSLRDGLLGLDDVDLWDVLFELEDELGIDLPDVVESWQTIGDIIKTLEEAGAQIPA